MNILITNDDGITASGIVRLAKAARAFGSVTVIAPETQRSAASHSITLWKPIDVWPHEFPVENVRAWACSGTPADCVRVGLTWMDTPFDAVFSGINCGYNIASDIQYSATVAAALEAAHRNVPAVALSEPVGEDHSVADEWLPEILNRFLKTKAVKDEIMNVNFPPAPCRGILENRTVSEGSIYRDHFKVESENEGRISLVTRGQYNEDCEEGSDFHALLGHFISVGTVRNLGG